MRNVRFQARFDALAKQVREGPGQSDAAVRRVAYEGGDVPLDLAPYVEKVRLHAYKVTDADVADLKAKGLSEDEIFEITVATAFGAGMRRYEAGLRAMRS